MTDKEHLPETPEEWARGLGAELHGMSAERWDAYVRYLDSKDEITQAFRTLRGEGKDLHAAWNADKFVRPEDQKRRLQWGRSLRERRTRRLSDLQARYEALNE